jgi:hypothetical protein
MYTNDDGKIQSSMHKRGQCIPNITSVPLEIVSVNFVGGILLDNQNKKMEESIAIIADIK